MPRYVIFDSTDGESLRAVVCGPDQLLHVIMPGESAIEDGASALPGYVKDGVYHMRPMRPSIEYDWDKASKLWVFNDVRARENLWARIKLIRDSMEFGVFSWGEFEFDGDADSQRRINLAVLAAQMAIRSGQDWSVDWTVSNNSTVTLSASDMIAVAQAMGANIVAAHEHARLIRARINAATTAEQLAAITWA